MGRQGTWSDTREQDRARTPGPKHLGWWAAVAMLVSLLLHVLVYFALDDVKIALGFQTSGEIATDTVRTQQVVRDPFEPLREAPEEKIVSPPSETATLLEEMDLLDLLPENEEIDISTAALEPEYALQISQPLASGEIDAPELEIGQTIDLLSDLPEMGRIEENLIPAADGQVIIDPGSVEIDDGDYSQFSEDLIKRGNDGLADKGKLDGVETLDRLLDLSSDVLLSKKTLLPSDLLFEFNSAELQEGARIGLMKLALLIDKNPKLYCWIEGHTDLIGTESANDLLAKRRAESVKNYLVASLRIDESRIKTLGIGERSPLVSEGDRDAQAPNRRVEIKMRKNPPADVIPVLPEDSTSPPRAVLIKPQREIPLEPELIIPRAIPVSPASPPRAKPVGEVPFELPVEE